MIKDINLDQNTKIEIILASIIMNKDSVEMKFEKLLEAKAHLDLTLDIDKEDLLKQNQYNLSIAMNQYLVMPVKFLLKKTCHYQPIPNGTMKIEIE